jgi:N-acetylglutamate synthase-like GNAT family acetyltransferase
MDSPTVLRLATESDVPAIAELIELSVMVLQQNEYTLEQRQLALVNVFGVDRTLIADRTYFVVESSKGVLAACGGWSKRRTLYGSDRVESKDDAFLDPKVDAAKIRAFFVHPDWARRGLGSLILETCEGAARAAGFTRLELGATLTGIPLYSRCGFEPIENVEVPLPGGATLPIVRMGKPLRNI